MLLLGSYSLLLADCRHHRQDGQTPALAATRIAVTIDPVRRQPGLVQIAPVLVLPGGQPIGPARQVPPTAALDVPSDLLPA
jgi:hypothetical protein